MSKERKPILSVENIIGIGPIKQGIISVVFTLMLAVLIKTAGFSGEGIWRAGTAGLGFFLLLNLNILFVRQSGFARYIGTSMLVFIAVVVSILFVVQQITGVSVLDLYVERMIFFAVAAFFVVGTMLTYAGKALFKAWGLDEDS